MTLPADFETLRARLAALEDERDIHRAIERYGHSIDYGLEADWVDGFTEQGVYEIRMASPPAEAATVFPFAQVSATGVRCAGRQALAQFIALHSRAPDAWHKHIAVDQVITATPGADEARAVSYFLRVDDLAGRREIVGFGRYVDRLVRCRDGRWRFEERIVELESNALQPAHEYKPRA
jgi:hypothetical protein